MKKQQTIAAVFIMLSLAACSDQEHKIDVEVGGDVGVIIKAEEELKQKYADQEEADLKRLKEIEEARAERKRIFEEKKKLKEAERLRQGN